MNNDKMNQKLIYRMIFVYQALLEGWTIKRINKNKFEFLMSKNNSKKKLNETDINSFIKKNSNIKEFMRRNNLIN